MSLTFWISSVKVNIRWSYISILNYFRDDNFLFYFCSYGAVRLAENRAVSHHRLLDRLNWALTRMLQRLQYHRHRRARYLHSASLSSFSSKPVVVQETGRPSCLFSHESSHRWVNLKVLSILRPLLPHHPTMYVFDLN